MSNPKNVRAGFKGSLTRFKDKVLAEDPETITESKLTVHHSKFEKLQLNIETNYSEILGACADDDERDNLIADQETVEDSLDDISFFLAECVEKLKLKEAQAAAAGAQNSTTPAVVTMQPRIKDLQIPKFSGQFDEWLTFSARFKSAVHNRSDITREQKMSYLVSYLDGQAATLVSHEPLTDDSYDPAWKKLQQYYEDKRGLVYTHADKLLNLPPVNTRSSSSILDLIAQVDNAMSTLETLGQPISICDILVVRNVLTKIGPALTAKFHDSLLHENPPTWNDLNLFLTRQLRDLPTCSTTPNVHQDPPLQTNKLQKNKQDFPTTCSICKRNSQASPMPTVSVQLS
ncbi:unnamed protein product [Allacma fusca]|uniref:Gag-pol polyprotein n=1 Tax=Allacma fusca TaxID=39272 RepID=A0A8J2PKH3_9HEXA|nr:unnamed protein product [Allacma fusca]